MSNFNVTVSDTLNFSNSINYLSNIDEEEYQKLKTGINRFLEIQDLQNELVSKISDSDCLRFLEMLNCMIKNAEKKTN